MGRSAMLVTVMVAVSRPSLSRIAPLSATIEPGAGDGNCVTVASKSLRRRRALSAARAGGRCGSSKLGVIL